MHAIAEVVVPPKFKPDLNLWVGRVMDYFLKGEGEGAKADWWDFWKIGGRFSGHKTLSRIPADRLAAFNKELARRKVTVSGMIFGREELQPASQIPEVDGLWREWFPGHGERCPLFQHAYQAHLQGPHRHVEYFDHDVCTVAEVPDDLKCVRLLVFGHSPDYPAEVRGVRHLVTEFWNGVEHQDTKFDGKVKPALDAMIRGVGRPPRDREDYKTKELRAFGFDKDWLVVTVDYHN